MLGPFCVNPSRDFNYICVRSFVLTGAPIPPPQSPFLRYSRTGYAEGNRDILRYRSFGDPGGCKSSNRPRRNFKSVIASSGSGETRFRHRTPPDAALRAGESSRGLEPRASPFSAEHQRASTCYRPCCLWPKGCVDGGVSAERSCQRGRTRVAGGSNRAGARRSTKN